MTRYPQCIIDPCTGYAGIKCAHYECRIIKTPAHPAGKKLELCTGFFGKTRMLEPNILKVATCPKFKKEVKP